MAEPEPEIQFQQDEYDIACSLEVLYAAVDEGKYAMWVCNTPGDSRHLWTKALPAEEFPVSMEGEVWEPVPKRVALRVLRARWS
jgi:hypothetical protein